ncbi:MAG: type II toxin-antitoxin system RelE/ParE family toxin [Spirosomaceae bacterium]|nr:type II toxin-antitoxin system RelE/ParE family toxin [Spirosomataceae bacterium]
MFKKFPSLRDEIEDLGKQILENPFLGTSLGNGFYKIRLSIRSKGKGKRGGARVITYIRIVSETVYLVSIYDKSEQSDILEERLTQLLKEILQSTSS